MALNVLPIFGGASVVLTSEEVSKYKVYPKPTGPMFHLEVWARRDDQVSTVDGQSVVTIGTCWKVVVAKWNGGGHFTVLHDRSFYAIDSLRGDNYVYLGELDRVIGNSWGLI